VINKAFLGRLKRKVARKSSHKIVDRGKIVLLFNAEDCKLVIDLSFERIDCLCTIIEVPTLLIELLVSGLFRCRWISS
jgi:hypothetical protein